jgi:hypothetical protein
VFRFPKASNGQCFRVIYLLDLPSEVLDMLNSNQTFSADQLGLSSSKLPGANLPILSFFDNFDTMFIRSCLESLGQHINVSPPEFQVVSF